MSLTCHVFAKEQDEANRKHLTKEGAKERPYCSIIHVSVVGGSGDHATVPNCIWWTWCHNSFALLTGLAKWTSWCVQRHHLPIAGAICLMALLKLFCIFFGYLHFTFHGLLWLLLPTDLQARPGCAWWEGVQISFQQIPSVELHVPSQRITCNQHAGTLPHQPGNACADLWGRATDLIHTVEETDRHCQCKSLFWKRPRLSQPHAKRKSRCNFLGSGLALHQMRREWRKWFVRSRLRPGNGK